VVADDFGGLLPYTNVDNTAFDQLDECSDAPRFKYNESCGCICCCKYFGGELLEIVFSESELTRILENISKEQPFQTKIDGKLSGGQQARIFIALTLWNIEKYSSKIVIFDEIESALDSGNRVSVLKKLYAYLNVRNIAAIWITHMCQCELTKCGIYFDGGRLLFCPLEDGSGAEIRCS
jgi:ABC-type dipeptide/oligopeptide/nickel transport system ATPase subunit